MLIIKVAPLVAIESKAAADITPVKPPVKNCSSAKYPGSRWIKPKPAKTRRAKIKMITIAYWTFAATWIPVRFRTTNTVRIAKATSFPLISGKAEST
ncbi:MAG TPA: hypothetical protein H9935_04765 [Candidatus Blautia merdigallinarum]|uniref:Uncharacterized protein n=1 Tax=Candidatus Blautia merdigallinarum TaxID=2838495 RepID=A0A9D2SK85_9FIRM|nr:hypothetical protein [Candidatus Blautia merdigallinarum]